MELVRRRLLPSRAAARRAILEGEVVVAGIPEPKPATLVEAGRAVRLSPGRPKYVSRAGLKLAAALERFAIDVDGRRAVDLGASTGGFTDCLLQHGAAAVVAVDVGYGQLHWSLRSDDRVTVRERTNIRHADPGELGAPFDVAVADLSFIGLEVVAGVVARLGHEHSDWVLLVKPQFELGPEHVARGGVVTDDRARLEAVVSVAEAFARVGVATAGAMASPIAGAKAGNREILLWLRRDAAGMSASSIREAISDE